MTGRRVLFLSGAPGVGGGERAVMPTLQQSPEIDLIVVAPAPVASYARGLGARAIDLELPRAHRLMHLPRIAAGGRRVRRLFLDMEADMLYANGTRAIPYALAAKLSGCAPLLFHHHGLFTDGPVRTLTSAVDRWADAIVTPSRTSAAPFRAAPNVHVIPHGIDVHRFAPGDKTRAKAAFGLDGGACAIGALTRPDPSKGMHQFLDVAGRVSERRADVQFVLGGGPAFPHEQAPFASVKTRAESLGVHVAGHVDNAAAFFRALDVLVHLGGPEGFGLVVAESLACGVPVVAYDWGAIPEVFAGLVTVVPPGDVGAAAQAIAALLDDAQRRAAEGRRGRAAVEQRFAIGRMVADLNAVVASLG